MIQCPDAPRPAARGPHGMGIAYTVAVASPTP
jgi:hypothetical protein